MSLSIFSPRVSRKALASRLHLSHIRFNYSHSMCPSVTSNVMDLCTGSTMQNVTPCIVPSQGHWDTWLFQYLSRLSADLAVCSSFGSNLELVQPALICVAGDRSQLSQSRPCNTSAGRQKCLLCNKANMVSSRAQQVWVISPDCIAGIHLQNLPFAPRTFENAPDQC